MATRIALTAAWLIGWLMAGPAVAQNMPADYAGVLKMLGRPGDYSDAVLKVNIPRNDLRVVVDGIATPTPSGSGAGSPSPRVTKGTMS